VYGWLSNDIVRFKTWNVQKR